MFTDIIQTFKTVSIPMKFTRITSLNWLNATFPQENINHYKNYALNGIFVDADCSNSKEILHILAEVNLCTTINPCVLLFSTQSTFLNDINMNKIVENYQQLKINVNADLKFIFPCDEDNSVEFIKYRIYDVYKISAKYNTNLIVTDIGTWSVDNKFKQMRQQYGKIYEERRNWNGVKFQSMSVVSKKLLYCYD